MAVLIRVRKEISFENILHKNWRSSEYFLKNLI